jgi:hypothetical protein
VTMGTVTHALWRSPMGRRPLPFNRDLSGQEFMNLLYSMCRCNVDAAFASCEYHVGGK